MTHVGRTGTKNKLYLISYSDTSEYFQLQIAFHFTLPVKLRITVLNIELK